MAGTTDDAATNSTNASKPDTPAPLVRVQVTYSAAPPPSVPPPEIHARKPMPATIADRKAGR